MSWAYMEKLIHTTTAQLKEKISEARIVTTYFASITAAENQINYTIANAQDNQQWNRTSIAIENEETKSEPTKNSKNDNNIMSTFIAPKFLVIFLLQSRTT